MYNFNQSDLYEIANSKIKNSINSYIEEMKDKGLLTGYFGMLAKNIYGRMRVKNSEILELLIYGAYIEEQSKLEESELNIFKDVVSFYYEEGQREVNQTLSKKKQVSVIPDAIFLALLDMPNSKGYIWKQYVEAIIKYNADQVFRQCVINIQQDKENNVDDDIFQNIIKKQQNAKLCVNQDKISGDVDLTLIGLNNQAKLQGIYSFDNHAKCKFVAVEDEATTKECHSLNGQEFFIHDWNEFYRYSKTNDSLVKCRCYGLVTGLNLPPINDGFHWCRSYIIYLPPIEEESVKFDSKENIVSRIKILSDKKLKEINKIALIKNIDRMKRTFKDFPVLKDKEIQYKVVKENNEVAMSIYPKDRNNYVLEINKNIFNHNIKNNYELGVKQGQNPKGTTYKDIATHEMGHVVSFEIIKKINKNNIKAMKFDYDNNVTTNNIVEKAFDNLKIYDTIKKEKIRKSISNYALKDSSETIGEAFADYYCNKEKSNILSKEIVNVMKGMIK